MKNIPKVNPLYWVLMIIATTTGEIVGNLISRDLGLGYQTGSIILATTYLFLVSVYVSKSDTNELFYWALIVLGNIGGTNIADLICIDMNMGTIYGSLIVVAVLLILILLIKKQKEEFSRITNFLYWLAIITSSTFGTTSGDFLTNDTPLGAAGGTIFLTVLLLVIIFLLRKSIISKSTFYWSAIVIIHPIGATLGNYISKPIGLDFGNVWTSFILVLLFISVYVANRNKNKTANNSFVKNIENNKPLR